MNKKIRTIIVDDNMVAANKLRKDLLSFPDIEVVECITSAGIAIKSLVSQQPDLLFLDIEMPEMSGLDLLDKIQNNIKNMFVVFYTAHNQYLIDAIRNSAFDYLQKPYLPEDLATIVSRLQTRLPLDIENFSSSLQQFIKKEDRFAIQTLTGLVFVSCNDVILFQYIKEQRCWLMRLNNDTHYKLRTNITAKELLSLHSSFMQINQQCIINVGYLLFIENKTYKCILHPPHSDIGQAVSLRYYKKIKEELNVL